ncbi:MAG TPA: hypothetical protein DCG72_12310 [Gammaproteobacteria bacterium]|nr:hypothetical protein [Gammaproteobacteria bacterium]
MAAKKFLFGTDSHGDMIDPDSAKRFIRFADDYRPHYRIHGGDVFDFRPLREGAGGEERTESMEGDVLAGLEFLDQYRPTQILTGNHDVRLWKKAESRTNGLMRDLCGRLVGEIEGQPAWSGAKVFPYDTRKGVFAIGDLQFVHGYHAGINAARQAVQTYKRTGSVIQGHVHSFSRFADMGLTRCEGITCGMLGKIDMPYNEKTPRKLAYENGWLFGEIFERKGSSPWECWFVRKDGNTWLNPLEI